MNSEFISAICSLDPMANASKLSWVEHLLRSVLDLGVPGSIVEVGAHRGSTTALLAKVALDYEPVREVVAYESFTGLPPKSKEDEGAHYEAGEMVTDIASFSATFEKLGVPTARLITGDVRNTIGHSLPESVCFAYIDIHRFSGTLYAFQSIYPHVTCGGVVLLDDYCDQTLWPMAWNGAPGVFRAIEQSVRPDNERPRIILANDDLALAYFRKK